MYMSPETITSQKNVGFPTDVWSLGVSIWEIVKRRFLLVFISTIV